MKRSYYVYILLCSDGTFYTGITNDMDRRLLEHQQALNPNCYTARRRPVLLKWHEEFQYVNDAIEWEKQIKRWSRKKKTALINGDYAALIEASKKKF